MLTGRNPWRTASVSQDQGYAMYLAEGASFLLRLLAISEEAAAVLMHVFDPNPSTRITLSKLRDEVMDVKSFFPIDYQKDRDGTGAFSTEELLRESQRTKVLADVVLDRFGYESEHSSRTAFESIALSTHLPSDELTPTSFINHACLAFDHPALDLDLALQFRLPGDDTFLQPSHLMLVAGEDANMKGSVHDVKGHVQRARRLTLREARLKETAGRVVGAIHRIAHRSSVAVMHSNIDVTSC